MSVPVDRRTTCPAVARLILAAAGSFFLFQPASAVQERAALGISVAVYDASGILLLEKNLASPEPWIGIFRGDPLTLRHGRPLSQRRPGEDFEQFSSAGNSVEPPLRYHLLFRHPDTTTACPYPVHPSGLIYGKEMTDGAAVLLRMPETVAIGEVHCSYRGEVHQLAMLTPLAAVELQQINATTDVRQDLAPEYRIAIQDCRSMIAASTANGIDREVLAAARLIQDLCELYRDINGSYPPSLCSLYSGGAAIVGTIPLNAAALDVGFCVSDYAPRSLERTIRYIPRRKGEEPEGVSTVGYWIAVLGPGPTASPTTPLPASVAAPLRAIGWLESRR